MAGSRKRKRPNNGEYSSSPKKKRRSSGNQLKKDNMKKKKKNEVSNHHTSKASTSNSNQKPKRRPRCHKLCHETVDIISCALRSVPCPIAHLLREVNEDGMPYALLRDIIPILKLNNRLLQLPHSVLPLLNKNEHIFQMDIHNQQFIVKYAPIQFNVADCTVYLDRLPYPCSAKLLKRFCKKYGTVVDVRLPLRTPRPLIGYPKRKTSTQHRLFAFVQFACKDEAEAICKDFALNHPSVPGHRNRWFFNRGRRVHLGQHPTKLAALHTLRVARMKRLKLRLEKELRRKLKLKQWRREWRDRRRAWQKKKRQKKRLEAKLKRQGKWVEPEKRDIEIIKQKRKELKKEKRKQKRLQKRLEKKRLRKEAKELLRKVAKGDKMSESTDSEGEESSTESSIEKEEKKLNGGNEKNEVMDVDGVSGDVEDKKEDGEKKVEGEDVKTKDEEEKKDSSEESTKKIKKNRHGRRKEIRKTMRNHFIDVQAIPFKQYIQYREDYLRMKKESEYQDTELMGQFRSEKSNHKRDAFRDSHWTIRDNDIEE